MEDNPSWKMMSDEMMIDRLRDELSQARYDMAQSSIGWQERCDELRSQRDAASAAIARVRAVIDGTPSADIRHLRARVRAALDEETPDV